MNGENQSADAVVPELLTLPELAKMLMVSDRTAWQWASDGTAPPPLRIGKGTVRYSRPAYVEWIRAGCKPVSEQEAGVP